MKYQCFFAAAANLLLQIYYLNINICCLFLQLVFTFLGDFFATILPLGGDNQSPAEALRQQQQQLPRGGGNAVRNRGFNLNDFAQFHPLDEVDEPQHRRFPPVEPPSEESITTLMVRHWRITNSIC